MKILLKSIVLISAILLAEMAFSQNISFINGNYLKITWQLIRNNWEGKPEALSSLTMENTGKHSIPAVGWSIYFNYNRQVVPNSVTGNVKIEHINGDIYRLTPLQGFEKLKPGAKCCTEYISEGELLNYTSAPAGFYIVFDQFPDRGMAIKNCMILPIVDTTIRYVTPGDTYRKNLSIIPVADDRLPGIFPTPVEVKKLEGKFVMDVTDKIHSESSFTSEAEYLANELATLLGGSPLVVPLDNTGKGIILKKGDMPDEAYFLNVSCDAIEITASGRAGIFYGIQSLRSLMPLSVWEKKKESFEIPCIEVKDAPRFGFRSLMLDVARNFQPMEQVKRVLDLMALYKLNVFHFHFSDDEGWRIEIPSLPELTQVGANRGYSLDSKSYLPPSYGAGPEPGHLPASGYYSRIEFIEILKYATERHIEVIPEIESPGHSRAAIKAMDARYERYIKLGNNTEAEKYLLRDLNDKSIYSSAQLWTDNVMCVALPSVYAFLEKVTDELEAMYAEANAPLTTIHMGGDEVPAGVWEHSPACKALIKNEPAINSVDDLWYYYFRKVNGILKARNLELSGWEEIAMRKTGLDGVKHFIPNPDFANEGFRAHVWNNGIGWGSEDLPYRLANAGYKVVLSCVSNQYFDLAYEKSPDEPGYYWGGFQDTDKPFYFIPFDYYKNSKEDTGGNPITASLFIGKDRLTEYGKSNILGIQGLLWAENVRCPEMLEYLLLPKMLALAERAWAKDPTWATERDPVRSENLYNEAWSEFVSVLGKRELPRLSQLNGGFDYRIPPVGAILENGRVIANCQFPGLTLRYTTDGSVPTVESRVYSGPIAIKGLIRLAAFAVDGRKGRVISIENPAN